MKKYLNSKSFYFKLLFAIFFAFYLIAVITSAQVDVKKVLGIMINNFNSSRRIVIKLNNLTPYRLNKEDAKVAIELINARKDAIQLPEFKNDKIIKDIQIQEKRNNIFRIEITLASENFKINHFSINNPSLVVVDIDRVLSDEQNLVGLIDNQNAGASDNSEVLLASNNINNYVLTQNLPTLQQLLGKDPKPTVEKKVREKGKGKAKEEVKAKQNIADAFVPYKLPPPDKFPTPDVAKPPYLDEKLVYSTKNEKDNSKTTADIVSTPPPTDLASSDTIAAPPVSVEQATTKKEEATPTSTPEPTPKTPVTVASNTTPEKKDIKVEPKSDIFIGITPPKNKKQISYKDVNLVDEFPIEFLKVPEGELNYIYTEFMKKDYLSCSQDILDYLVAHLNTPQLEDLLFMEAECKYNLLKIGKSTNYEPAINNLRLALRKFPETNFAPYAYLRLAQSYYNMEWYQEAAAIIDVANSMFESEFDMQMAYIKGESLFRCNSYDMAASTFEKLITNFPKSPNLMESYFRLGEINYKKERYLAAYDNFSKGEKLSSDYPLDKPELLFKIAKSAYTNENYKKARETFNAIIKNYPNSNYAFDSMELMGDSYLAQEDKKNTLLAYAKFIEKCNDRVRTLAAQIHLAELGIEDAQSRRVNKNIKAQSYLYPIDTLKDIMLNYPDNELAQVAGFKLGAYYANQKQVSESVRLFNFLLKKYPNSKIKVNIEDFLRTQFSSAFKKSYEKGNYLDSIQLFKDNELYLVEGSLGNKIFFYLGDSYYNLHLYDKSIRLFEKVIESYNPLKDKDIPIEDIYYESATMYSLSGDPKKSIYICEQLRQKFPASNLFDKTTLLLSRELVKLGKYTPTLDVLLPLKDSLTLNKDEKLDAMILITDCYKNTGNNTKAVKAYHDALSYFESQKGDYISSPHAKKLLFDLADVLYENKNYDEAITTFKRIVELYPKDNELPQIYYKIGKSEIETKNLDIAKGYLEKAKQITSANSLIDQLSNAALQEIDWKTKNAGIFE